MNILSNAFFVVIPVLIFVAFLVITKKDQKEDELLKKRINDSIKSKSSPSVEPEEASEENILT